VRIAVVVQRYGAEINGGAELHARYVAEHLARHAEVDVLTTCARDYVTWENELRAGVESINGVPVRRFPVARPRTPVLFAQHSATVFNQPHSLQDELAWLDSEGPTSPALLRYIETNAGTYDWFLVFSYRYHHAYHGSRAVAKKAVLVPTAERDATVGLAMFPPIFRGVRALMFNSFEERAMLQHVAGARLPGVIVGIGSELPERPQPERFRQRFGVRDPFAIYVGRIDENKGCKELFAFFQQHIRNARGRMQLLLIGNTILPVPDHPMIRHLGFVSDEDKFDAMAAADVLIMPSYYESLSMVALEAWGLGTPVLANGRCDVLKGQCLRSNGGLFYESYSEFGEALGALASSPSIRRAMGRNGMAYFRRHYTWPVIERKYLQMFEQLAREPEGQQASMAPLPGYFARRKKVLPPGMKVLAGVPEGAVLQ
jgi:glycosyltransferase involved in cell wall biosynthesis